MLTPTIVGAIAVVVIFLLSMLLWGRNPQLPPDAQVLAQLRKGGSDLSKPHPIEFCLYFPTRGAADRAAKEIREQGFDANVDRAAKGDGWLCFTTQSMVPTLSALQHIRKRFETLASSLGGQYDGWGTPVVN